MSIMLTVSPNNQPHSPLANEDESSFSLLPTIDYNFIGDSNEEGEFVSSVIDPKLPEAAEEAQDFGGKDIGILFSVCLLLNNITGPGMVSYPALFQQSGWFGPMFIMILCAVLSAICGICLMKAMAVIPHNSEFELRYEFLNVAEHYCRKPMYRTITIFFLLSLYASVVPMIIQSSQVMDFLLVEMFKKTCGLQFYPEFTWACAGEGGVIDPFANDVVVLSIGVLILAIVSIPVGYFNLDDNKYIQYGAAAMLSSIVIFWVGFWSDEGLDLASMPSFGRNYSQILGIVVFNYTFVSCLPSWVNEKSKDSSLTTPIWLSLGLATLMFSIIGIFGALAYSPFYDQEGINVLNLLYGSTNRLAKASYYLFPLVADITSIPIYCIVIRYNLLANHICGKKLANFLSAILPWLITIPFYTGNGFSTVVNWTGVFVNGVVNFLIPMFLYIQSVRRYDPSRLIQNDDLIDGIADIGFEDPITEFVEYTKFKGWFNYHPKIVVAFCVAVIFIVMLITVISLDIYYLAIGQPIN